MISHNNACNGARLIIECHGSTPDSITWTPLPLIHLNATVTTIIVQTDARRTGGDLSAFLGFRILAGYRETRCQ